MQKKGFIIALVIGLILVVTGVVLAYSKLRSSDESNSETPKTVKPIEKVNLIPVEERPYVAIEPNQNGRNLQVTVYDLKKPAEEAEVEMEYQTGDLLQGAMLPLDLAELPASLDMLLGSCSAGGKCSYHEDVSGGSLLLRFLGAEKYVLKNDWAFIENKTKETIFVSRDSKFRAEGANLARVAYGVILQSPGLPENVERRLLSAPYVLRLISPYAGQLEVSIRVNEDVSNATILGWDGEAWQPMESVISDKVATATGPFYDAYVVVE